MPRGGRRPGAGAPKGNLNGLRSGRNSLRFQSVLAAMLGNKEIRGVLLRLRETDDRSRDEIREVILASTRLLFDAPVSDEIRRIAERAAQDYLARLPRGQAQRAVARYRRQLGYEDLMPPPPRRRPRLTGRDDPAFLAFAAHILGTKLPLAERGPGAEVAPAPTSTNRQPKLLLAAQSERGPGGEAPPPSPINPAALFDAVIESEIPELRDAIRKATGQSNAQ